MPAVRLSRRRRSSLGIFCGDGSSLAPIKPGNYGIYPSPPPRPVTFAPNVTPGTFVDPEEDEEDEAADPSSGSPTPALFPPSQAPAPAPSRRRVPPGKRRSLGYIPRPPNAFMLFRADFVRQKHVPGSIETNHGSLSKIIGNCWRALPLDEKRIWEVKAKHAKADHKARYPNYRFRPVHNKNKDKKKDKPLTTPEDERRCEEVAQLLLEGKKGDDLAAAVRDLDRFRSGTPPALVSQSHRALAPQELGIYAHRRSSSVPLPSEYFPPSYFGHIGQTSGIAIPTVPTFTSRPASPVHNISRSQRMMLGQRRASSARPAAMFRSWTMPGDMGMTSGFSFARDPSPLPEANTSLFESTFLDSSFSFTSFNDSLSSSNPQSNGHTFNVNALMTSLPRQALGPLDTLPHESNTSSSASSEYDLGPNDQSPASYAALSATSSTQPLPEVDPLGWYSSTKSATSSADPSSATATTPTPTSPILHAPQPQTPQNTSHATVFSDIWFDATQPPYESSADDSHMGISVGVDAGMGVGCETSYVGSFEGGLEAYAHAHHQPQPQHHQQSDSLPHPQHMMHPTHAYPHPDSLVGCGSDAGFGAGQVYEDGIFAEHGFEQGWASGTWV